MIRDLHVPTHYDVVWPWRAHAPAPERPEVIHRPARPTQTLGRLACPAPSRYVPVTRSMITRRCLGAFAAGEALTVFEVMARAGVTRPQASVALWHLVRQRQLEANGTRRVKRYRRPETGSGSR